MLHKLFQKKKQFAIIGLGNPGSQYAQTRHNFGYRVIDAYAKKKSVSLRAHAKTQSHIARFTTIDRKIIIGQPDTFMNESGRSVAALLNYFGIPVENCIIIYDDVDLPLGTLRCSINTSSGGHNGVRSILKQLNNAHFIRLRLGIGPSKHDVEKFVLGKWSKEEEIKVSDIITLAGEALDMLLVAGLEKTAAIYNQKSSPTIV